MNLHTEIQRNKLKPRTAPYWAKLSPGHHIGVRRYPLGFTWCAKNGSIVTFPETGHMDYDTALKMVVDFWSSEEQTAASYTVRQAVADYCKHQRIHKGMRSEIDAQRRLDRHLAPFMGRELSTITQVDLADWHQSLVKSGDPETIRKSKTTANRTLAIVKACFTVAFKAGHVDSNTAWTRVEAFKKVDSARTLFLSREQVQQLLAATDGALYNLIRAGSTTGARIGELVNATIADLDVARGMLSVNGKTGERDVVLSTNSLQEFIKLAGNRSSDAPLLLSPHGCRWKSGEHSNVFAKAVKRAGLPSETVYYSLRHYAASMLIKSGINLLDVSANLGTGIDMLSKHYYKFLPTGMKSQLDNVAL